MSLCFICVCIGKQSYWQASKYPIASVLDDFRDNVAKRAGNRVCCSLGEWRSFSL